jgi:pilus assembly protein Flp/PilA
MGDTFLVNLDNNSEEEGMLDNLKKLLKDEEAPTAVEYALMVAGIAVAIVTAVYLLGTTVKNMFTSASTKIK